MTNTELFSLISKPWASAKDIRLIASCGRDNAILIRNKIINDITSEGKHIPSAREIIVPMKRIIEYLDINIDYITEMAKNEKIIKV